MLIRPLESPDIETLRQLSEAGAGCLALRAPWRIAWLEWLEQPANFVRVAIDEAGPCGFLAAGARRDDGRATVQAVSALRGDPLPVFNALFIALAADYGGETIVEGEIRAGDPLLAYLDLVGAEVEPSGRDPLTGVTETYRGHGRLADWLAAYNAAR